MHQSVKTALPGFLKEYEGKVNFMYLDVKGLVTVGIGHLIDPVDMALKLEFGPKGGGGGAVSAGEITAEWQTVKSRKDLISQGGAAFGANSVGDIVLRCGGAGAGVGAARFVAGAGEVGGGWDGSWGAGGGFIAAG